MDWTSAGLASRLWPAAVLEFYLDYVVIRVEEEERKHGEDCDREQDESGEGQFGEEHLDGIDLIERRKIVLRNSRKLESKWIFDATPKSADTCEDDISRKR